MEDQPYQSLYRRYRPQRFSEVRGQDHVAAALSNAVRRDQVSHAYLFSGPRGTGKTSTARILAKALNCEATVDGEPCGTCESCVAITRGSSLDVHELDAASNNGVEAMRDLVSRAALATPGRHKVYIIDEVHMLSTAASNTLLKTLEEPPPRVVFVLATTDPHKVLQTITSRTQHFEFRLLPAEVLAGLLSDVQSYAGLDLAPDVLSVALKRGNGSARDALSALDQLVAAEGVSDEAPAIDELMEALCERDAPGALLAVARGIESGRDAARLATELIEQLRQGFLATMAPELVELGTDEHQRVGGQAGRLGTAALVRAMEALGQALVDMRDSLDPRLSLELTLVRLTSPESDTSIASLLERIERLERGSSHEGRSVRAKIPSPPAPSPAAIGPATTGSPGPPPTTGPPPATGRPSSAPANPDSPRADDAPASPAASARAALGAMRATPPARRDPRPSLGAPPPLQDLGVPATSSATPPSRDDLVEAWGDHLLEALRPRARSLFRAGRFLEAQAGAAVFALPDSAHCANCEAARPEVEAALSEHFATPVRLRLVVDDAPGSTAPSTLSTNDRRAPEAQRDQPEEGSDNAGTEDEDMAASEIHGLPEADVPSVSAVELLLEAFPGAERLGGAVETPGQLRHRGGTV
ncbi:MAG: DNA polymerase III subunit gamma/tau [Acidimicrobiales bacterium]